MVYKSARERRLTLSERWNRMIRTWLWKMDIHPTARVASTALIDRTWPRGVHIGPNCVIDEQVSVLTHDMTRGLYLDTFIGAGSIIGMRAIILPGVKIGRNCVVFPGALVNRDLPDGASASGNPAEIVLAKIGSDPVPIRDSV